MLLPMQIKSIQLQNFRNYQHLKLTLNPGISVFIGNNGQGKTNLLEALFFLASTRSFRQVLDKALINDQAEVAKIQLAVLNPHDNLLSSLIHPQGKTFFVGQNLIHKTSEFMGLLNVVMFTPQDLQLVYGPPRNRRRLLDLEIGKLSIVYLNDLKAYYQLLKERNDYLKRPDLKELYLAALTEQLVDYALKIAQKRQELVQFLAEKLLTIYQSFTNNQQVVEIIYQTRFLKSKRELLAEYSAYLSKDRQLRQTQLGIQKDELLINFNGQPAINCASQGQIRLIILALKLALLEFGYVKSQTYPILLLDDVFSELDQKSQANLLSSLPASVQTLITTTHFKPVETKIPINLYQIKDNAVKEVIE